MREVREMKPRIVLLALAILGSGLAWSIVHRALGRIRSPRLRSALRAFLACGLAVGMLLLMIEPIDRGTWQCRACGKLVERTLFCWIPVASHAPQEPEHVDVAARRFEAWYASRFGVDEDHDWRPVGCHSKGLWRGVGCAQEPFYTWYRALPRVPDEPVALAMLARVRSSSRGEREELMGAVRGPPWDALAEAEVEISRDEFLRQRADWLASHPAWR
jgi:hypothetical protein